MDKSEIFQSPYSAHVRVVHVVPRLHGGGAEPVAVHIAEHQARYFSTSLVTWLDSGREAETGVDTTAVSHTQLQRNTTGILGACQLVWALAEYIRTERPSHVVSHLHYTNLCVAIARLISTRSFKWIPVEHSAPARLPWHFRLPLRLIYRVNGVGAVSSDVAKYWAGGSFGRTPVILPNPIEFPAPTESCSAPSGSALCKPRGRSFIAIGRLDHLKNYEYLIEVAKFLPDDYRIDIFGSGPDSYRATLQRKLEESTCGAKVALRGTLPRDDLLTHMKNYDALVMTSHCEGEPTVVLESAVLGLPVIGRDTPGLGSCVRKVGGIAVDSQKTPNEFAEVLMSVAFESLQPLVDWRVVHEPEFAAHRYCEVMNIHHGV